MVVVAEVVGLVPGGLRLGFRFVVVVSEVVGLVPGGFGFRV
jgi:hypothetical protein